MPVTPKKILIVEDERPLSRALELKLRHSGFAPETAYDGVEALKKLSTQPYDLMLLDLVMPKLDGFELLKRLHEQGSTMPVMVLSNLGQEEDMKRAKDIGVKEYFVKSNTPLADIVEHITHLFSSSN